MKKIFIMFSLIFTALFFVSPVYLSSIAEQPLRVNEEIKYHYFAEPLSITVSSEGIAVLDSESIKFFDTQYNLSAEKAAPSGSKKIMFYGENLYILASDGLYRDENKDGNYTEEDKIISGSFTDMSISDNGLIYFAENDKITVYAIPSSPVAETAASPIREHNIAEKLGGVRYSQIESLTVKDSSVWFSVAGNINKNYSDVYLLDTKTDNNNISLAFMQQDKILSLTYGNSLLAFTDKNLILYENYLNELKEALICPYDELVGGCYYEENIYTLDLFGTIKSFDALGQSKTLIASASDEIGFYNMPVSAFTKNGAIIVGDYFNNRIAITDNHGTRYISDIRRPIAAAADNDGNYYVAHNIDAISIYDIDLNFKSKIGFPEKIKNLVADSFNRVFVLAESGLYLLKSSKPEKIDLNIDIVNIYCASATGKIYLSTGSEIYYLTETEDGWVPSLFKTVAANKFAVDDREQLFVLENSSITRYDNEETQKFDVDSGSSDIFISTVKNQYVDYGDMLIVNPVTHSVNYISQEEIGTKPFSNSFDLPNIYNAEALKTSSTPIIRKTDKNTIIYKAPYDSEIIGQIKRGQRVIVDYVHSTDCYNFILYNDALTRSLVYGYIYTESLSPLTYEYAPAAFETAVVYNNNTPLYKYPSVYSTILKKAQKDERIKLLTFSAIDSDDSISEGYYLDDQNYKWYRIEPEEGCEGYILASDLSLIDYKTDIYPQLNGEIIEYEGNKNAPLYAYDSVKNKYAPLGENIKAGTRIEILDLPFDPSEPYCKILYYKDGYGTIECYVPSEYVKYISKNVAQYVALTIILCCILLGVLTVLLIRYTKKRNKLKTN